MPGFRFNYIDSINSLNSINSKPVLAAFNPFDDSIFQPKVIHKTTGAVIVGPFFHNNQFLDAIGLAVFVVATFVLIILINSIITRMLVKAINPFLLPNFDVVRFAAFGQHPGLKIADGDQTNAAPETCCPCVGKSKY